MDEFGFTDTAFALPEEGQDAPYALTEIEDEAFSALGTAAAAGV